MTPHDRVDQRPHRGTGATAAAASPASGEPRHPEAPAEGSGRRRRTGMPRVEAVDQVRNGLAAWKNLQQLALSPGLLARPEGSPLNPLVSLWGGRCLGQPPPGSPAKLPRAPRTSLKCIRKALGGEASSKKDHQLRRVLMECPLAALAWQGSRWLQGHVHAKLNCSLPRLVEAYRSIAAACFTSEQWEEALGPGFWGGWEAMRQAASTWRPLGVPDHPLSGESWWKVSSLLCRVGCVGSSLGSQLTSPPPCVPSTPPGD